MMFRRQLHVNTEDWELRPFRGTCPRSVGCRPKQEIDCNCNAIRAENHHSGQIGHGHVFQRVQNTLPE
jgi:hypothetical protein